MKKVISFLLAAVLLLTAFSGCASSQKPQAIVTKPVSIDGTEAVGFTEFDGKLIRYLRQTGLEQENFTVSPLSFKAALVLLLEGADGESKRQLLDALGFSSVEEADLLNILWDSLDLEAYPYRSIRGNNFRYFWKQGKEPRRYNTEKLRQKIRETYKNLTPAQKELLEKKMAEAGKEEGGPEHE